MLTPYRLVSVVLAALIGVTGVALAANDDARLTTRQLVPGQTIKHPDYLGRIRDERAKSVAIAIIERNSAGRAVRGRFEPRSITLHCDGPPPYGSELDGQLPPIPIYFRPDGRVFDGSAYSISGLGDETTVLIHGKLKSGKKRAAGTIVVAEHSSADGVPYCTMGGRRPWSAVRIRR